MPRSAIRRSDRTQTLSAEWARAASALDDLEVGLAGHHGGVGDHVQDDNPTYLGDQRVDAGCPVRVVRSAVHGCGELPARGARREVRRWNAVSLGSTSERPQSVGAFVASRSCCAASVCSGLSQFCAHCGELSTFTRSDRRLRRRFDHHLRSIRHVVAAMRYRERGRQAVGLKRRRRGRQAGVRHVGPIEGPSWGSRRQGRPTARGSRRSRPPSGRSADGWSAALSWSSL